MKANSMKLDFVLNSFLIKNNKPYAPNTPGNVPNEQIEVINPIKIELEYCFLSKKINDRIPKTDTGRCF